MHNKFNESLETEVRFQVSLIHGYVFEYVSYEYYTVTGYTSVTIRTPCYLIVITLRFMGHVRVLIFLSSYAI